MFIKATLRFFIKTQAILVGYKYWLGILYGDL